MAVEETQESKVFLQGISQTEMRSGFFYLDIGIESPNRVVMLTKRGGGGEGGRGVELVSIKSFYFLSSF